MDPIKLLSVSAARLSGPLTGVARYIGEILRCWALQAPVGIDRIVVHSPRPITEASEIARPWIDVDDRRSRLPPIAWENAVLPIQMRRADAFLASSFTMPVFASTPPSVLLVYDALQALRPGDFSATARYVRGPFMRASIRRANILVTISEAAKTDIVNGFGVDPERLHIVPGGVGNHFRPLDNFDRVQLGRMLGIADKPYILFVGKLSTRRNIPEIIAAAGLLRKRGYPHTLLLVGYNTMNLPILGLAQAAGADAVHIEGVSDSLLVDLYNGADLFVQAPIHETYSLPLIEAMACGTPAVTSDAPGLREIGGTAPYYLEETTPQAIAGAVQELLGDASRRAGARQAGLDRAVSFRWQQRATRLAELCVLATQVS